MLSKRNLILFYLSNTHKANRLLLIRIFTGTIMYQKVMINFKNDDSIIFLVYTKTTLNGKSDVVRPFSSSTFDNHPSLDRANLPNSQLKHSTIVSIFSVLNCVFERIANRICVNEAKSFVSNLHCAHFSSSQFNTEKQRSDSASLDMLITHTP